MDWIEFLDGEIERRDRRQRFLWALFGYSAAFFGATSWYLLHATTLSAPPSGAAWALAYGFGGCAFTFLASPLLRQFLQAVQPSLGGPPQTGRHDGFVASLRPSRWRSLPDAVGAAVAAFGVFFLAAALLVDGWDATMLGPIVVLVANGALLAGFALWFYAKPGRHERPRQKPVRRLARMSRRLLVSTACAAYAFVGVIIAIIALLPTALTDLPRRDTLAPIVDLGGAGAALLMALVSVKLCVLISTDRTRSVLEQLRYGLFNGTFPRERAEEAFSLAECLGPLGLLPHGDALPMLFRGLGLDAAPAPVAGAPRAPEGMPEAV